MGKTIVRFSDLESVNFDKFCRLVLEIAHVRRHRLDDITFVVGGPEQGTIPFEGSGECRDYAKRGFRSMTEMFAIRAALGTPDDSGLVLVRSDDVCGLASLCRSLAENHGKVPGVKGGTLYRKGTIPTFSKSLILVPDRACAFAVRIAAAIAKALDTERPIASLIAATGPAWNDVHDAIASAERAVADEARAVARSLYERREGSAAPFRLANAPDGVEGVLLTTRDPNLVKHLWAALKAMEPELNVATIVARHPDTGRIAVTCSTNYAVNVRPVAEALELTFGEVGGEDFEVNAERKTIVWDRRFAKGKAPSGQDVARIVGERLAFPKKERPMPVPQPRIGATLADAFAQKRRSERGRR